MTAFLCIGFLALLALSVPVAVALGLSSLLAMQIFTPLNSLTFVQQLFNGVDKFPLAAIPFFILAGNLMEASGISTRLVDLARALTRNLQGGLAISCVAACMIFAAVSGSSVATTFAIGAILIPAMQRAGYPLPGAAALQAASAELGVIIPPSIPMILFGVTADVSIGELFIAGVIPGVFIGAALGIWAYVWCRRNGYGKSDGHDVMAVPVALRRSLLALMMPVVVLGGIYGGIFTPTEASIAAVCYALVVGVVVYRTLGWREITLAFNKSVVSNVIIMLIIATAAAFAYLITRAGVPRDIGNVIMEYANSPVAFLLVVNVALFIIGMFIDASASVIVLAPILTPIAIRLGIDPVHFGTVMVVNLALGMITPPFGVNLFAACSVARISYERIIPAIIPLVVVVAACLMVITYVPSLSLFLRDLVYH
jgi:C4-dicarboxylate transporter, DctM subunit